MKSGKKRGLTYIKNKDMNNTIPEIGKKYNTVISLDREWFDNEEQQN